MDVAFWQYTTAGYLAIQQYTFLQMYSIDKFTNANSLKLVKQHVTHTLYSKVNDIKILMNPLPPK